MRQNNVTVFAISVYNIAKNELLGYVASIEITSEILVILPNIMKTHLQEMVRKNHCHITVYKIC
jgi:hypothetical protein